MKLNDLKAQFTDIGVGVAGITYDKSELIQAFDEKWRIDFPILKDVERQHVEAWGVRNQEYGPGTFGYGVPYPGVVFICPEGQIFAKWAVPGYRSREDWSKVLQDVSALIGGD